MVLEAIVDRVEAAVTGADRREDLAFLFRDHYASMVRLAFLLTSDRGLAEDLAQEAFVRTWRAWNRIRKEGSAPAYLRATVVNLSRSSLRRRLVERRHSAVVGVPPAHPRSIGAHDVPAVRRGDRQRMSPAWDGDGDPAGRVAVLEALRRLPHGQRSVIVLRYHLDFSEQQTAEALGIAPGTVKSQTHKALARLGELLRDQD